jgi:DNA-binding SARP family transcriptional activator
VTPVNRSGSWDDGPPSESGFVPALRIELLGGFHVERIGVRRPVVWQRRSARTLTKLLAAHPRHSLHREEILDLLWPGVPTKSALNRFGQALHAARRAFEPELLPREGSAYLRLKESVLSLETEHVVIDADHFQQLAESALGRGSEEAYESALAAYGGELLPEDRYHDWCAERRAFLAELRIRLLVELADSLEDRGALAAAADRLRGALRHDPTREDIHRRLIALYAGMGTRDQAARQFQMCREVLQRELGLLPTESTVTLYNEILADRIPERIEAPVGDRAVVESHPVAAAEPTRGTPTIGHVSVLRLLREKLGRADKSVPTTLRAMKDAARRATQTTRAGQSHVRRRAGSAFSAAGSATGFQIFRIAFVSAILVSALVFLVGLFSGGDSTQQSVEVARAPPAAPNVGVEALREAQKTKAAGAQDNRSHRAREQAPGDSHSSSGVQRESAAQPGDAGGDEPVVTPQPGSHQPRPEPKPSPRPQPTPAPTQVPTSSQTAPPEPVETVDVANNNTDSP